MELRAIARTHANALVTTGCVCGNGMQSQSTTRDNCAPVRVESLNIV